MEESTHYGYVSGWLLPAGINVEPQPVLVANDDYTQIVGLIGGNCRAIDAVRHDVGDTDGNSTTIVGYVDDEGLYDQSAEPNYLASVAFGRAEPLMGNVVVVGGVNPDTGEYDGDNHDLPDWLASSADSLVTMSADVYNKSAIASMAVLNALSDGLIGEAELQRVLDAPFTAENLREVAEMATMALRYAEMQMTSEDPDTTVGDAVERLTSFDWEEDN